MANTPVQSVPIASPPANTNVFNNPQPYSPITTPTQSVPKTTVTPSPSTPTTPVTSNTNIKPTTSTGGAMTPAQLAQAKINSDLLAAGGTINPDGSVTPKATPAVTSTTPTPTPTTPNIPPAPTGIDTSTTQGQMDWYNQDPNAFKDWAKASGWSDTQIASTAQDAANDKLNTDAQTYNDKLAQLANGTYPLTPDQLAALSALQQQWQLTIDAQKGANETYSNAAGMMAARSGRGEYNPINVAGSVQQAIDTGISRIANFQAQETVALNNMRQGFMDSNFKQVTESYNAIVNNDKAITDEMNTMYTKAYQAQKDASDAAEKQKMDDATIIMNNHTMSYQDKQQAFDKLQLDETQRHNLADEQHQRNADAIAAGELAIKQNTYNATYGQWTNMTTGQTQDITSLPGIVKSSTGAVYFDPSQFSDKDQATAAENVVRKLGVTILSDKTDRAAVDSLSTAVTNLDQMFNSFREIAPKDFDSSRNDLLSVPMGEFLKTDTGNLFAAYQKNRDNLFQQINALAGSHPRINMMELTAAAQALPELKDLTYDTLGGGIAKVAKTYGYLENAIKEFVPSYQPPILAIPVNDMSEAKVAAASLGKTKQLNDFMTSHPDMSVDDTIQWLNQSNQTNQ